MFQKIAQLKGHQAAVYASAKGREPGFFLSGSGEGWIVQWQWTNPDMGKLLAKIEGQVFALVQLARRPLIVAGDMNGGLHWIDLENPANNRDIAHHKKGVFSLLDLGEGLVSAGGDGRITRWAVEEMRAAESLLLSHQSLRCLDYCPARNEIAAGASDRNIYILDAETLEIKHQIPKAHLNSVFTVQYAPDGNYLLSGGRDAHLKVWDTVNWKQTHAIPAHWYTINDIAFHPQGHLFATASRDKTVKIWDAATFDLLQVLGPFRQGGHLNSVNTLLWTEEGLISGSDDRTLILWEIAS
ncbi:MAG: WD40 repeat domain-containing protein [Haliscomenobacter sp.]|nr:WD40 repeat domain-containing protein [Haliscomenobacter sp.]